MPPMDKNNIDLTEADILPNGKSPSLVAVPGWDLEVKLIHPLLLELATFQVKFKKELVSVSQLQAKLMVLCDRFMISELPESISQYIGISAIIDNGGSNSVNSKIMIPAYLPSEATGYDQDYFENVNWFLATVLERTSSTSGGSFVFTIIKDLQESVAKEPLQLDFKPFIVGQSLFMSPAPIKVFIPLVPLMDEEIEVFEAAEAKRPRVTPSPDLVKVKSFTKAVSECINNFALELDPDQKFVDLERVVKDILMIVYKESPKITSTKYRVPPLVLMRLARGGKTLTIAKAFDELKVEGRVHPILISFNGNDGKPPFRRPVGGESHSQSILRLIAAQLDEYTPYEALNLVVDREALDRHLGNNVVLLIDELNSLGEPLDEDAARLLREMFLDKAHRYLVFTCHVPVSIEANIIVASDLLGKSMNKPSSLRGVLNIDMSLARTESDFKDLRNMSENCLALTEERAAWLGYIPSLIYSTMNDTGKGGVITPTNRCQEMITNFEPGDDEKVLKRFVKELLTGNRDPFIGKYFSPFQSVGENHKVSYPLCYVKVIFAHIYVGRPSAVLIGILDKLEAHLDFKQSGLEWECTVQVAIILQMLAAHYCGSDGPFQMVDIGTHPALAFHTLPDECNTVEEASRHMAVIIAGYTVPTLIYWDTANARFPEVEGFVVYTCGNPDSVKTIGFQMKKSDVKPRKTMDTSLINGGAVLIRGRAKAKNPREPKTGWRYMTTTEVRELLGNSLLLAMPRDMLQELEGRT
eukprot:gene6625-13422_t